MFCLGASQSKPPPSKIQLKNIMLHSTQTRKFTNPRVYCIINIFPIPTAFLKGKTYSRARATEFYYINVGLTRGF
jgi:hypothetical protein